MAYSGGFLEFAAPLTLAFVTHEGPLLYLGMLWVLMLHGFILSNLPIAAVFEWNVLSIYTAVFLFVGYPEVSLFAVGSLPLSIYLVIALPRVASGGKPVSLPGLVSRRHALLCRQLGLECMVVPR